MGQQYEVKINQFDGGMSDSLREPSINKFSITKLFDIFTDKKRLIPYRSFTADQTNQNEISNFLFSSTGYLMGLGTVSGQNWPQIYVKNGASPITDNWNAGGAISNFAGTGGTTDYNLFIEYNGYIYLGVTGKVVRVKVDGTEAMNESFITLGMTDITGQGFVHPYSQKLFIPNNRKIATVDSAGATDDDAAPSISTDYEIVALAEAGSYLAIGCRPTHGQANSKVFLWDMVQGPTGAWTDVIDFGDQDLQVLNNLDGALIGIMQPRNFQSSFYINGKVTIKRWTGGAKAETVKEIELTSTVTINRKVNFINNNILYFGVYDVTTPTIGLFALKLTPNGYVVTCDKVFADSPTQQILAAIIVGDYCWINYNAAGTIVRTSATVTYTQTSVYESQIFNHGDSSITKKLIGVSLQTEKLSSSGQAVLKYRIDGATSWTTIFTNADDTSYPISFEAINISGATLPQFREIEFRIESINGAVITGFSFKYELIDKRLY